MNQIPISKFKIMKVAALKEALPFQVTADGSTIAVVSCGVAGADTPSAIPLATKTKCPNCKFEYLVTPPDGKPPFFTVRHPPE